MKRTIRVAYAISQIVASAVVILFLLLVTSLGLHWWHPLWGVSISRVLLAALVALSVVFSALYWCLALVRVWGLQRLGYHALAVQRLLISVEVAVLFALFATWGRLVAAGQPAMLPLWLLVAVWIVWSLGFAALHVSVSRQRGGRPVT